MPPTLQSLGIDQMSVADRISLAVAIWDSIPVEAHQPLLTESQRQELDRRIAEYETNPHDVIPWEQVKAGALKRFQP